MMSENSSRRTGRQRLQKVLIIGSGLAFLGTMIIPMFGMFQNPQTPAPTANQPPKENLQAIAQGYEKVLVREPENPTALQGLAEVRLQMGYLKGAIPPLEKLVKLYPQETQLKQILEAIQYQVKTGKRPPMASGSPNPGQAPPSK